MLSRLISRCLAAWSFLICDSAILSEAFLSPTTIKVHVAVPFWEVEDIWPNYLHLDVVVV